MVEAFNRLILDGGYGSIAQIGSILLFVLIFNFIIKKVLLGLQDKFKREEKIWHRSFVSSLYQPLSYFVWLLSVLLILNILSIQIRDRPIPQLRTMICILVILSLAWFFLRWKTTLMRHMVHLSRHQKIKMEAGTLDLLSKVLTIAIIAITALSLMEITGNNIQTLVALGGISGVALAFASQQFIANFFGGLTIHMTRPFSIGELIKIPDRKIEGYVEDIGWYMTSVRDLENYPIYIPNSIFNQSVVSNSTRVTYKRIHLKLGIRYQDIGVIDQVVDNIRHLFQNDPLVYPNGEKKIYFTHFGATSLEIEVSGYLLKEKPFEQAKQELLIKLAAIVSKNGAELSSITNIVELKNSTFNQAIG